MAAPPVPRITHLDTLAPTFARLFASRQVLWPADGRLVPVSIRARLVDLIDQRPTARIVGVSSNASDAGHGHGHGHDHDQPDFKIIGPLTVLLRAEHNDHGVDRVYTIDVAGRDAAGNTTLKSVEVRVVSRRDHSRGHRGH